MPLAGDSFRTNPQRGPMGGPAPFELRCAVLAHAGQRDRSIEQHEAVDSIWAAISFDSATLKMRV